MKILRSIGRSMAEAMMRLTENSADVGLVKLREDFKYNPIRSRVGSAPDQHKLKIKNRAKAKAARKARKK